MWTCHRGELARETQWSGAASAGSCAHFSLGTHSNIFTYRNQIDIGLSNLSLARITITLYTMVKSSSPVWVLIRCVRFYRSWDSPVWLDIGLSNLFLVRLTITCTPRQCLHVWLRKSYLQSHHGWVVDHSGGSRE